MRLAVCSYTSKPNTPETDKLPEVEHVVGVNLDNGAVEEVLIFASDPIVAINLVNSLDDVAYNNLRRN